MKTAFLVSTVAFLLALPATSTVLAKSYAVDRTYSLTSDLGTNYTVFEHSATNSRTRYVQDSGICETTKGVRQYSGYFDVGTDQHMFFWFFEARNNSRDAPLALWLNGGPGCSSMLGLFRENGPCTFGKGNSTEPTLNPHSWNNFANMLYVDQPIGVGFSYGMNNVTSTVTAAPYVWALMQAFYAQFSDYKNRDFGLFTESYGGHYGAEFVDYFQDQNDAIEQGKIKGEKVKVIALGINNGWIDATIQIREHINYARDNPYRRLINDTTLEEIEKAYEKNCVPAMMKCTTLEGNNDACIAADNSCYDAVEGRIENATTFNVYDIRAKDDKFPAGTYKDYIQKPEVFKAIGAKSAYQECSEPVYDKFESTGDGQRSYLDKILDVRNKGVQVLLWAGDSDFICNYLGNYNVAKRIGGEEFEKAELKDFVLNGKEKGEYKTIKNLSWLRVYEAGHEVPAYQPEVALEAFKQTMSKKPICSPSLRI
ncbi:Carboxypeptidase S1 [Colletotrichum chlorophyti]|uniref:Carboxypeptidase n=1 Tax=Colletotrichum chlorophyti TaxID=708187 RepID=A0A1Q8RTN2_9PEZI|nr:Carboxypeptidase S1 [Colletotrichum chlorophyti]